MTFILAFARPDVTLLASDTRQRSRDLTSVANFRHAPIVAVQDGHAKLGQLRDGWFAVGGACVLQDALRTALAGVHAWDIPEIQRRMRRAAATISSILDSRLVAWTRETSRIYMIGLRGRGFYCFTYDWQGEIVNTNEEEVTVNCPADFDEHVLGALLDGACRTYPGGRATVPAVREAIVQWAASSTTRAANSPTRSARWTSGSG